MRPSLRLALLGLCFALPLSAQNSLSPQLERVRAALDKYRDPVVALGDGYLSTLVCMEFPAVAAAGHVSHPAGGMGVHLLNAGLIGPQLDSLKPQVLIYEPVGDSLKLVAAEWFVPVAASPQQPELFGRKFDGPMEGHPPIMPTSLHHWDLHVWLWKPNPAGTFSSTNPALKCPAGPYTVNGGSSKVVGHGH
jgi:hypothetical protein